MDGGIDVAELKYVVGQVTSVYSERYGEPMPDFDSHDAGRLQGALSAPFQSAFGQDIYESVFSKAAALFYFVAKDHPFENGNKRTAVIAMLWYLATNGFGMSLSSHRLYRIAVAAVASKLPHDVVIKKLAEILEDAQVSFEDWTNEDPPKEGDPVWPPEDRPIK